MPTTLHLHDGTSVAVTETLQEVTAKLAAARNDERELAIFTSPDRLGSVHFAEPIKVADVRYAEAR